MNDNFEVIVSPNLNLLLLILRFCDFVICSAHAVRRLSRFFLLLFRSADHTQVLEVLILLFFKSILCLFEVSILRCADS